MTLDPLTRLLNEMARRRLDPSELDTLRAAVHETVRPIFDQLSDGEPAAAAAEQETWTRLLDHFPGTDPAAEPIADGAAYVRQIADAVRVENDSRGPADSAQRGPAVPTPAGPTTPGAPALPRPAGPRHPPTPTLRPAPARTPVLPWLLLSGAVVLLMFTIGAIGVLGLLRLLPGQHPAGAVPAPPAGSATPADPAGQTEPATTAPPQASDSPTGTAPSAAPQPPIEPPATGTRSPRPQPPGGQPTTPPPGPSVVFTGTTANPTIAVNGNNFGTEPAGAPWRDTPCGSYTDNGRNYGDQLWFADSDYFHAGNDGCIGIKVVSWSPTRVVFQFGNSYNTFDHWYVTAGDPYEITLMGQKFTGTITFS
jgi:hypothetical protein